MIATGIAGLAESLPTPPSAILVDGLLDLRVGMGGDTILSSHRGLSRSRVGVHEATLTTYAGRVGVDVETLSRIARNATVDDAWLAGEERDAIDRAEAPLVELASRWVLKEAYGKALGIGLAMPLAALWPTSSEGTIVFDGPAAPPAHDRWRFMLFRHGELIVGIAYRPDVRP